MSVARALFSSATGKWATPAETYAALDAEFGFTLDPCPMDDAERIFEQDGILRSWAGERVFCNPPYGRGIGDWLAKAREADVAVYLLPSRTDTAWWHDYALGADEIRFIRGRLRFGGAENPAPFPSVVLVYRGAARRTLVRETERREPDAMTPEQETAREIAEGDVVESWIRSLADKWDPSTPADVRSTVAMNLRGFWSHLVREGKVPAPPSAPPAAPPAFVHDAKCELNVGAFACECGKRPAAPLPELTEGEADRIAREVVQRTPTFGQMDCVRAGYAYAQRVREPEHGESVTLSDGTVLLYDPKNGRGTIKVTHRGGECSAWFTPEEFSIVRRCYPPDDEVMAYKFSQRVALAERKEEDRG